MEINSIDDLVKLAGLVKSQEIATEAEVEEDCGCQDAPAEMSASPDMYAILSRLAKMGEVHEDEIVDEWANTPAETGEPESRVMDLPKGEPVDTSLRRHMGANAQPVRVEEAIQDHTVEDMMEAYSAFKNDAIEENSEVVAEAADTCAHCGCEVGSPKADCDCKEDCHSPVTEAAVEEAEVEEDNAFNTAAANAKKAGKDEFEFNGKKYKVKMDASTADALTDDVEMLRKLAGL